MTRKLRGTMAFISRTSRHCNNCSSSKSMRGRFVQFLVEYCQEELTLINRNRHLELQLGLSERYQQVY